MPLDNPGARAPLSPHAQRLARLKLVRRRARAEDHRRRRVTQARLKWAEELLAQIIDGADVVAGGDLIDDGHGRCAVFLLVTINADYFRLLCEAGAELEDDEDTHDAEAEIDDDDQCDENSLAATGMIDQRRWHEGMFPGMDLELDEADREPSLAGSQQDAWCSQEDWASGDRIDREEDIGPDDRELPAEYDDDCGY